MQQKFLVSVQTWQSKELLQNQLVN